MQDASRHLPVRPNLDQLKHQAKDLRREMKRERPEAELAEAQFALARSYGVKNWPRLVLACQMVDPWPTWTRRVLAATRRFSAASSRCRIPTDASRTHRLHDCCSIAAPM